MKLQWDVNSERYYETGVRNGVLYPRDTTGNYPKGVVWNGLISVSESPSGAETTPLYADDIKYLSLMSAEEFAVTIEAYTYPDEFAACDGTVELADGVTIGQQPRQAFGMVYRTVLGNGDDNENYGYKLHIFYNGLAAPSEKPYSTINDSPEAITFSWEVSTTPVAITGNRPSATITIDSTKADTTKLAALEDILYGTDTPDTGTDARLPLPDEIVTLFATA